MAEEHRHQYRLCLGKIAEGKLEPKDRSLFIIYLQLYRNEPMFAHHDFDKPYTSQLLTDINSYLDDIVQQSYVNYGKPLPADAKKYIDEMQLNYQFMVRRIQAMKSIDSAFSN